jgi:hypothetical protein
VPTRIPAILKQADISGPFLVKLRHLYDKMDRAYDDAAKAYGFACSGCEDNCCLTRFYHHTYLEHLYISQGFSGLDPAKQKEIIHRAKKMNETSPVPETPGPSHRLMCPVNFEGRCILYDNRPMICRLHGIPHEFRKPDRKIHCGTGCETFDACCGKKAYIRFDRTPIYIKMAALEKELRAALGAKGKIGATVAEMVLALPVIQPLS